MALKTDKKRSKAGISCQEFFDLMDKDPDKTRLVLIHGDENYLAEQIISRMEDYWIAPGGRDMDMNVIDTRFSEKFDMDKLIDAAMCVPWMSKARLVVVKGADITAYQATDKQLEFLKELPSGCAIVFWDQDAKFKSSTAVYKAIAASGVVVATPIGNEREVADWIRSKVQNDGYRTDDRCAVSIAGRCQYSLMTVSHELEKLYLYCDARNTHNLTYEMIEECCPPDFTAVVFDIMDSCGTGSADKALSTLSRLLSAGEPVARLRSTVVGYLRKLIIAKELGNAEALATELGMHPYPAGKMVRQVNNFTMDKLIKLYIDGANYDSEFKHGNIDERMALELLIIAACGVR